MPPAVPAQPGAPSVLVAVLTYQRPADLAAVLPMLDREAGQVRAATGAVVELLVVDNDPQAGATDQVAEGGLARYVHEPRPGIAAARNKALDEAAGHDLLVFIDDDERPSQGWLTALLSTFEANTSCGVVGPVVSSFAVPLDPWVSAGGFFTRRRMPTGSPVTVAATNNLLLDVATVLAAGIRFDERLGLAGGSDTLFTRRLVAAAGPLIWCDEAVVTDVVPAARTSREWVLRRQLRSGNSWSRTALMLSDSPAARWRLRLKLTAMAGIRLIGGPAGWLAGLLTGSLRRRAAGAKVTARGLGILMGAYGVNYAEYRRPAVSSPSSVTS
jgi:glycosyltransferase involved in cell wall biosynthesis